MVKPIRENNIHCVAGESLEGMYIIGKSRASDLDIPHLPVIECANKSGIGQQLHIRYSDSEIGKERFECDGLLDHFNEGDVVWVSARFNEVRSVLSSRSNANTLLLTEQCENRCRFCSQPPNTQEDTELYHRATLALLNHNTQEFVGLSGGEPTHNEKAFLRLLQVLREFNNKTKLHILSNGRKLGHLPFAEKVADLLKDRVVLWGIPLYGHKAELHDQLVGGKGAFIETIKGLSNLTYHGQAIELRIVPVSDNIGYIYRIVEFITSNYLTINTISIMNMEPKGLARKNFSKFYVNVEKQVESLEQAIQVGERYGVCIRLFNYPLCLLSEKLRAKAVRSISDWKNHYPEECADCKLMPQCGGMFSSAVGRFQENIRAIQ